MKHILLFIVLLAAWCGLLTGAEAATVTYRAPYVAKAPVVDGTVDESVWSAQPWSSPFVLRVTGKPPVKETRFKAVYAADAVYIAVECRENEIAKIADEHQAHEFWLCDVVEFYSIAVANEQLHLICSARGNLNDEIPGKTVVRTRNNIDWSAKAKILGDRWTCEFRVPFLTFGRVPDKGAIEVPFNLCRNATTSKELSSWSFQSGSFKSETGFGRLVLEQAPARVGTELARLVDPKLIPESPADKERRLRKVRILKRLFEEEEICAAEKGELAKGKPLYWGTVDPMGLETYMPDSDLPEETVGQPLLVGAAKGEYEAASFVVRPMRDVKSFLPVVSEFRTKDGKTLPANIVDTRIVKVAVMSGGGAKNRHIRVKKPVYLLHDDAMLKCDFDKMESYIRLDKPEGATYEWITKPGDSFWFETYKSAAKWPIHDAAAIRPLDLRKALGQQFWFTFHVPEDAAPGLYRGKVDLTSEGRTVASVPVKLRVLPFVLPEPRTSYDLSRKIYPGVYWRNYNINFQDPNAPGSITSRGRNVAQVRAELRSLKAHGILYPTVVMELFFPGWDGKNHDRPDYSGVERKFTPEKRQYFFNVINLLKEEGFPMDKLFFHSGGNWGFRCDYDRSNPMHREVLKRSVEATYKMVYEAVGHKTDAQFYGVDEAWGERLKKEYAVWEDIRALGGRIFTTAVRSHTADLVGCIDTQIASGAPDRRFAKMHHDAGALIWNYANPQAGTKDQARPYRTNFGFGVYSENYDGFATYAWNVSAEHPWNDFDNRVEPDLAFVIPTADGVVDTPSHEGYREGVDDIRYATLLRMLCKTHPGAKADEATKFLDSINVYARTFDPGETRLKIIEYILDLR
ncbi:MAG: hypothetical protein PHV28_04945 [Kiritimatiellae bacterium]|nr:hypothetical protein [Kiritimatiellia bacterium]